MLGQAILATPVIANYTLTAIQGADEGILPTARTLGANNLQSLLQLAREVRFGLVASIIAGFGRVISEVGVAMMLGGNIRMYTRTMTTAIALETGKGDFSFGLALGVILMAVSFAVNVVLTLRKKAAEHEYPQVSALIRPGVVWKNPRSSSRRTHNFGRRTLCSRGAEWIGQEHVAERFGFRNGERSASMESR